MRLLLSAVLSLLAFFEMLFPGTFMVVCRYAELVYNGFWFSPEREALQAAIDSSQKFVSGTVRLKLYKVSIAASLCRILPLLTFTAC